MTATGSLTFDAPEHGGLTHRMFRYPAKFHPPVAAELIERFSSRGDTIFDPFCGSGTVMVESSVLGRDSIGSDVDPLAIEVSRAKTTALEPIRLKSVIEELIHELGLHRRTPADYAQLSMTDIDRAEYERSTENLWIPEQPNLEHWYRRYVVVDLGTILHAVEALDCGTDTLTWLRVVFASVIRNASNADPVPVSGLEVTSHMKRLDAAGRIVDPFSLFVTALRRAERANTAYWNARTSSEVVDVEVRLEDATSYVPDADVSTIITSPPYQNAVDYYRRHQLEMFWLGLTRTQRDRLDLLPKYIGKHRVAASNPVLASEWEPSTAAADWLHQMEASDAGRARDFRAYMASMNSVFERWHETLAPGRLAVCVVGRSSWNGADIPTEELFVELAHGRFSLSEHLTYPVKNRYMSYARRNGANIQEEHVLVLRREAD